MIGHKHAVVKRSKDIMSRCRLIHNRAFLECEESKEKKDALKGLENVVRSIGTALEQQEKKEISVGVLEALCISAEKDYYKIIEEYPWLSKFDLHPGVILVDGS